MGRSKDKNHSQPRKFGRVRLPELLCSRGKVQNISAGGMAVLCRSASYRRIDVVFIKGANRVHVQAERVWVKRLGIFKRLVGYRFLDAPDDLLQRLNHKHFTTEIHRVI